jgi:signal transduction histidine kinase
MAPVNSLNLIVPFAVSLGLLLLVMARQGITILENEWLRQEWEMAYANDLALREAAQQMDAFLGIASHELKTPLTTIMLGLQLIQRHLHSMARSVGADAGKDSTRVEICQAILGDTFRQGRRLGRLVDDLLDTSRIREGQLHLRQQPADLIAIISAAVEEQRQVAPERSISLHLLAEPPVSIFADPDRIGQVVTNYLTNALKYSSPESPVEVGVQVESQRGRVWVRDRGPGLPSTAQEHIWERFHRIPEIETQSGSEVGLGLGLHICKTIIELHQGQVGVESVPGEGATFWFTIPLSTEARQNTL